MSELIDDAPLHTHLTKNNIPWLKTDSLKSPEVSEFLFLSDAFIRISFGAPWILSREILAEVFRGPVLNAHGTQLPRDRGAGGFSWRIMQEHRLGSCLLHLVDEGLDTGPILQFEEFLYPSSLRLPSEYEGFYQEKLFSMICDFLSLSVQSDLRLSLKPQAHHLSTYWPRLSTEVNGWINWDLDGVEIERFVRAFDNPYGGASTRLDNITVRLRSCTLTREECSFHPYQFGMVYRKNSSWVCVAARNATLIFENVSSDKGENLMESIKVGDRFFSLSSDIEASKRRVSYNASGMKKT